MGVMKEFDIRIRNGGDDAIAAVAELWETREKILFDITDAFTKARWIPVEERLPEANGRYLVVSDPDGDPYPDAATWFEGEWWTGWSPSKKWGCDVTHWMPLPEPPEVK